MQTNYSSRVVNSLTWNNFAIRCQLNRRVLLHFDDIVRHITAILYVVYFQFVALLLSNTPGFILFKFDKSKTHASM